MKTYRVHWAGCFEIYNDVDETSLSRAIVNAAEMMFVESIGEIGTNFEVVCEDQFFEVEIYLTPDATASKTKPYPDQAADWAKYKNEVQS